MAYGWYDLIAHITGGVVTIMAFGFLGAVTGIIPERNESCLGRLDSGPGKQRGTDMPQFGPLEVAVLLAMVAIILIVVRTIASLVVRELARKRS